MVETLEMAIHKSKDWRVVIRKQCLYISRLLISEVVRDEACYRYLMVELVYRMIRKTPHFV